MTAPAKRAPEPVTREEDSQSGWWREYGGRLDPASGVIAFPPQPLPPCPFPCALCGGSA